MREIKFMAFIKAEKRIAEVVWIDFMAEILAVIYEGEFFEYDFSEVELMEYTGLKDKNGKEIYEGDGLRIEGFIPRDDGPDDDTVALVNFENGSFEADFEDCVEFLCCITDSYDTEVIGNKYENPELLENI